MFKAEQTVGCSWWAVGVQSKRTGVCSSYCYLPGIFSSKLGSVTGHWTDGMQPGLWVSF
jgi:hypothetical protein